MDPNLPLSRAALTIMRRVESFSLLACLPIQVAFGRPVFVLGESLHLLYLDESGSVADPAQRYFVLAGVSVFERQTHWIESELNKIARRFDEANPHAIELHGSPMRSEREGWKAFPLERRQQAIKDCLEAGVANQQRRLVRLFGAVIRKDAVGEGKDPVALAFEQLSSRFDRFLVRIYRLNQDAQRGVMILDKSSTERRIQTLAREFKHRGHAWGQTRNYAEVPVFLTRARLA